MAVRDRGALCNLQAVRMDTLHSCTRHHRVQFLEGWVCGWQWQWWTCVVKNAFKLMHCLGMVRAWCAHIGKDTEDSSALPYATVNPFPFTPAITAAGVSAVDTIKPYCGVPADVEAA